MAPIPVKGGDRINWSTSFPGSSLGTKRTFHYAFQEPVMFRRFLVVSAVFVAMCALLSPSTVMAQSKAEGIHLFKAADALREKAQTNADLRQAVQKYEQALKIFERVGSKQEIGVTANNLGIVFDDWGQYDKAVEYYEKSLAIKRELKDRKGEGQTLNNLGNVFADWGQYGKAVDYYEKSLAIKRELKDRKGEGQTLNNLGNVFMDWGQYDKAVDYYEESLAIKRELKDRKGEGQTLNNLGVVFKDWGQYDKAVDYYEKSLAIKRELKDRKGEGSALLFFTLNGLIFSDYLGRVS